MGGPLEGHGWPTSAGVRTSQCAGDVLQQLGLEFLAHVREIVAGPPDERRIAQVVAILRHLSERAGELDQAAFAPLRILAWLPAEGENASSGAADRLSRGLARLGAG